ncbi:MAG: hypothetical protein H0W68_06420 [Gemmatimonadaceae bacterium]|nr:hypothetical protein [Gemmatimonadaceae bacterium]
MRFGSFALAASLAVAPTVVAAQRVPTADVTRDDAHFSFYARGPYRTSVTRPDDVLRYAIGAANTQYGDQEKALLAIAGSATDRVRVEEFASTYERRAMRIYVVSSPENMRRLDDIRRDLDKLADPRGASAAELETVAARTPAVVWISGSVHGNESPGFEACIQLLYQLAASEEPATLAALRNALVIINPSANPDGHERFTVWYNSVGVASPDPMAQEHREPWSIQGRYNHYRFDMNRDLIASTQREVQGIMRMMLKWHPMVAVDLHGHVSSYFFPPAARPVNAHVGPGAEKWLEILGRGNASAFDRYGWQYYSRDVFDLYYPGYYDSWPSLNGAIGMTFETDGGGHRGLLYRRPDGSLVSLRDGIAKHYVASMATIETTARNARARVTDYAHFRQEAVAEGRSGAMRRVMFSPGKDPGRAAELVSALLRAGIEVRRTTAPVSLGRAHAYYDDATITHRFDAGSYVVDLAQPQGRLARAILEPTHELDSVFANAQVAKFRRNQRRGKHAAGEDYEFYDITAWSLPVAFGVEAYWTDDTAPVSGDLIASAPDDPAQRARYMPSGIVGGLGANSAFLFSPERNGAARLAWHLLAEGFRLGVSGEPVDAGGRRWPRGTYVAYVGRNDSTLARRIDALAREAGIDVTGVSSAFASTGGQYGIGSSPIAAIPKPDIAVVADEGVSQTGYGAIWYSFEQRYGISFTPIGFNYLANGDLSHFTSIVMPSGSYGSRVGKDALERLKTWVRAGGTLVTMGGATGWAAEETTGLTTARAVKDSGDAKDDKSAKADSAGAKGRDAAKLAAAPPPDRLAEELIPLKSPSASAGTPEGVPGIHADVLLDRTHWLTAGYDLPRQTVMLETDVFLKPSKEGANVAVFPVTGPLVRAGFTWPGNTERLLRGTSFLIDEPLGRGHVVLFANEPMFRGWWRALDRMVLNAVLLGPAN